MKISDKEWIIKENLKYRKLGFKQGREMGLLIGFAIGLITTGLLLFFLLKCK